MSLGYCQVFFVQFLHVAPTSPRKRVQHDLPMGFVPQSGEPSMMGWVAMYQTTRLHGNNGPWVNTICPFSLIAAPPLIVSEKSKEPR